MTKLGVAGGGEFTAPAYDDGGWSPVTAPGHWRSHPDFAASDCPLLYRRNLPRPLLDDGRRAFLILDGVFYYGDVWLDGDYLGATEGYFFPHAFEVGAHLRSRDEHVVAIEAGCPPQRDRTAKRTLTGVFSHWGNLDTSTRRGTRVGCGGRCGWSRPDRCAWPDCGCCAPRPGWNTDCCSPT